MLSRRYTDKNLRQMMNSRVDSTRAVGEAIARRWEQAQADADAPQTRRVALRTAMVMTVAAAKPAQGPTGSIRDRA